MEKTRKTIKSIYKLKIFQNSFIYTLSAFSFNWYIIGLSISVTCFCILFREAGSTFLEGQQQNIAQVSITGAVEPVSSRGGENFYLCYNKLYCRENQREWLQNKDNWLAFFVTDLFVNTRFGFHWMMSYINKESFMTKKSICIKYWYN